MASGCDECTCAIGIEIYNYRCGLTGWSLDRALNDVISDYNSVDL